ncbi:hypothetical protein ACQKIE_00095 [Luteibacter sp. NPDC031894]|uniref:hypothetical protein n=1 Tax=Luteibacter sp. NPDC031894 TaxID=3390572 RepID=UPI003D09310B
MIVVELPIKTVGGLNAREHWRKRAARVKAERHAAWFMLGRLGSPPVLPVIVTMTRKSAGVLDDDNLQGAMKAIRDGIADYLYVPDNDPRIQWRYAQERCKRGQFGVRIEVEAIS